jgi:hypothetical protein
MPSPDRHFATAAIFTQSTGLTPNSGDAALYIKSDNKAYIKDSAGAEVIVGGTGTIAGTLGTVDNAVPRADGTGGITAQGSDIVIDDATTSTQNNVTISNQHSGQTNSALVLSPKGTGAFILGPKPDGTATGGNARGIRCADLQVKRVASTQVASGQSSALLGGEENTASGGFSAVIAGIRNVASGVFNSAVIAGTDNTASGERSVILGGELNTASGQNSFSSGSTCQSSASNSFTLGQRAQANRFSMQAHSAGAFAFTGDAQRARFVLRNKTTNATATELFLDGSSTRLTIPSGKYLTGTINIAGIKSDGATAARYIRQFSIKNVAATTSLVGTIDTVGTDIANSTTISITADDTNDALKVEVTGIASETWRWVASVDVVEVAYGA